jgi:hypothetical protein
MSALVLIDRHLRWIEDRVVEMELSAVAMEEVEPVMEVSGQDEEKVMVPRVVKIAIGMVFQVSKVIIMAT